MGQSWEEEEKSVLELYLLTVSFSFHKSAAGGALVTAGGESNPKSASVATNLSLFAH